MPTSSNNNKYIQEAFGKLKGLGRVKKYNNSTSKWSANSRPMAQKWTESEILVVSIL